MSVRQLENLKEENKVTKQKIAYFVLFLLKKIYIIFYVEAGDQCCGAGALKKGPAPALQLKLQLRPDVKRNEINKKFNNNVK